MGNNHCCSSPEIQLEKDQSSSFKKSLRKKSLSRKKSLKNEMKNSIDKL